MYKSTSVKDDKREPLFIAKPLPASQVKVIRIKAARMLLALHGSEQYAEYCRLCGFPFELALQILKQNKGQNACAH